MCALRAANDKAGGRGHRGIKTVSERTADGALGFSEGVTCVADGMDFKADESHQGRRLKRRRDWEEAKGKEVEEKRSKEDVVGDWEHQVWDHSNRQVPRGNRAQEAVLGRAARFRAWGSMTREGICGQGAVNTRYTGNPEALRIWGHQINHFPRSLLHCYCKTGALCSSWKNSEVGWMGSLRSRLAFSLARYKWDR